MKKEYVFFGAGVVFVLLSLMTMSVYATTAQPVNCSSMGCECMTEEQAKERFNWNYERCSEVICGYDYQTTTAANAANGIPKYCFKEKGKTCHLDENMGRCAGNCPSGMMCQMKCECVSNQILRCHYDYEKNACIGLCPDGESCQINTITRDPETGKVTYAECHCKGKESEPVKPVECPQNCKCLPKAEAEKMGLNLCNNEAIVCGYTGDNPVAAVASQKIPKYCFEEKKPNKPEYEKCSNNCRCMDKEKAYKEGYILCNGEERRCGASADGIPFYCFQKTTEVDCVINGSLIVKRMLTPFEVELPGFVTATLTVEPKKTGIMGVIITEHIPDGLKIAKASMQPDSWDSETGEAKWIIKDPDGIEEPLTIKYILEVTAEGKYTIDGTWLISSNETCRIIGDDTFGVKLVAGWPPCPIGDLEMLHYIDLWGKGELTDRQILQAIYVWSKKPDCGSLKV